MAQWIPLFNGRNLDGWTPKIVGHKVGDNFGDTFRVVNGVIQVGYEKYGKFNGRFGHLFYKTPFSRYFLRIEYRFTGSQCQDGPGWALRNSGVMLHGQAPETMDLNQDFPCSVEVQFLGGLGDGKRSTANLCTPGTNVVFGRELVTRHCTDSTSDTYHGEQWVSVEIEVDGANEIVHRVKGREVLRYREPQLDPNDEFAKKLLAAGQPKRLTGGTISLQSESHPVEFRRVDILDLGRR
ncbi:MAG: 3-keto-disaccharide hydrolase [Armatimonadaceae bacterium]